MASKNGQYQEQIENLFKSFDVLINNRLEKVKFDRTIVCRIINDSNKKKGEYIVTDGSTDFTAYSENDSYKTGNWVYVTIPQGDNSQLKVILGKYVDKENGEYSTYKNPLDSYLDITGNIYFMPENGQTEWSTIANDVSQSIIPIWYMGNMEDVTSSVLEEGYTRIGIQAKFLSLLNKYKITSGHYGLRLDIAHLQQDSVGTEPIVEIATMFLDSDDMFGNPYNFSLWSEQQCVFDISSISNIIGMRLSLYQNNNFYDQYNRLIPVAENEEAKNVYFMTPNLFVKDFWISLGYDLEDIKEDKVLLYTLGSSTYLNYLTEDAVKQIQNIIPNIDLTNQASIKQALNILNKKDIHLRWIRYDGENAYPVDSIDDIETYGNYEASKAAVHWYRLDLHQENVDPLTNEVYWKEVNTEAEDRFLWKDFIPDSDSSEEQVKVVIEYPTLGYLETEYQNSLIEYLKEFGEREINFFLPRYPDDDIENLIYDYLNKFEIEWETAVFAYPDNAEERDGLFNANFENQRNSLIEDYGIENPDDEESFFGHWEKALNKAINEYYNSFTEQHTLYYSDVLVFKNEHKTPDQSTLDLLRGLTLECDPDGLNGIYRLYSQYGSIKSLMEASKLRPIIANFDLLYTGDRATDAPPEWVAWYFPKNQTMIQMPENGYEYFINYNTGRTDEESGQPIIINEDNTVVTDEGDWYKILRSNLQVDSGNTGTVISTSLSQNFRIKDKLVNSYKNNTIKCEIYKNGRIYSAEYELYFSTSGINGTDYSLFADYYRASVWDYGKSLTENLENENLKWIKINHPFLSYAGRALKIVPHVINYKEEVVNNVSFFYDWYSTTNQDTQGLDFYLPENKEYCIIYSPINTGSIKNYFHYILKVTAPRAASLNSATTSTDPERPEESGSLSYDETNINLQYYIPIATRFNTQATKTFSEGIDGSDAIIYNSTGSNPEYYKQQYRLYEYNKERATYVNVEGVEWFMDLGDDKGSYTYYPQITTNGYLTVPNLYMLGNKKTVSILAKKKVNNKYYTIWCQPLYIGLDPYVSPMLNSWDGSLTIDKENNTIMTAMLGAGYKDVNNQFNGVFMGQVGQKLNLGSDLDDANVGVFGYSEGIQSFGLKIDGTAFLGKQGRGQIQFDGNKGIIKSGSYNTAADSGMLIDLDDGIIDIKGSITNQNDLGNNYQQINLRAANDPVEPFVQGKYYYWENGAYHISTRTTANGPRETATYYKKVGNEYIKVKVQKFDDYYATKTYYPNTYYLYNGSNYTLCVDKNFDSTKTYYQFIPNKAQSHIHLGVSGLSTDPYFQIVDNTSYKTTLMEISNSDMYLQSSGFGVNNKKGVKFDLKAGTFDLSNGSDSAGVFISSTSPYITVTAGGKTLFQVGDNGVHIQSKNQNFLVDYLDNNSDIVMKDLQFTADNFDFTGKGAKGQGVHLGSSAYYLHIWGLYNNTAQSIMQVGDSIFRLQSADYAATNGASGMRIDLANGTVTMGGGKFQVTSDGQITATGLKLDYSNITSAPNLTVYVQKDGTIGTVANGSTGFKVSSAGLLQASNAVIYGTVYASAGEFTGTVNARRGVIGSETNYLTLGANDTSNVAYIYSGSHNKLNTDVDGFWLSNNGLSIGSGFQVSKSGNVTISNGKFVCETSDFKVTMSEGFLITNKNSSIEASFSISGLRKNTSQSCSLFSNGIDFYLNGNFTGRSGSLWFDSNGFNVDKRFICDDSYFQSAFTRANPSTLEDVANLAINANGTIVLIGIGSSQRYKCEIQDADPKIFDPSQLYNIPFRQFKYKEGYFGENALPDSYQKLHQGFIAEEVYQYYPAAASVRPNGDIETWSERNIIPPMLALIQEQHKEIEQLKQQVKALINR